VADAANHALQALDDGHALLQAGKSVVRGKVRISTSSDFGRHVLRGWLDEFNKRYPEVRFALVLSDSLSSLLQDDIDLAIRFGVPQDSSFVTRPLAPNRRALCASPGYLKRHGAPGRNLYGSARKRARDQ
jgi:DNA-binding transcriptional LysR family regulator